MNVDFADEEMTVTLELDDGEVECAVITILTVENKDYIVLLPLDENGDCLLYTSDAADD